MSLGRSRARGFFDKLPKGTVSTTVPFLSLRRIAPAPAIAGRRLSSAARPQAALAPLVRGAGENL